MATSITEKLPWWMNPEWHVGNIVHKRTGLKIEIYYRDRYPDDATYALVTEERGGPKLICELWLGRIIDD